MKKLLLSLLFLFLSVNIFAQQNIEFLSIKTFEGGLEQPAKESRIYKSTFNKNDTRYIWCEINLKNKLYDQSDQFYKAKWIYYDPDGSIRGTMDADWNIKKEWSETWHQGGWGWSESGKWPIGTYTIKFYLDDNYLTQTTFNISEFSSNPEITFISLKFFESGKVPDDLGNRIYAAKFNKSTTRYVYYEVNVNNLDYNLRENPVEITAKYYLPDGSLFGSPVSNTNLSSSWETAKIWHSWGWAEPGNWEPGNYKVELYYLNSLFAEGYFTISAN